jgi:hypothetical protein
LRTTLMNPGTRRTEDSSMPSSFAPANAGLMLRACTIPAGLTPVAHFWEPSTLAGMS